jgi:fused signal recognition particle receptor
MSETPAEGPEENEKAEGRRWFGLLKSGLGRSSDKLTGGITDIFTKRKLDEDSLAELEELLIMADLGPATAAKVAGDFAGARFGKDVTPEEVRGALAEQIATILESTARPLEIDPAKRPFVVLVVGVNGTGKTTTIGKLAKRLRDEGRSVMLCAGDTFRAAAIEQLQIWGERIGAPVVAGKQGASPAGLAYDAFVRAKAEGTEVLLVDTAGRLHNKAHLMEELEKIIRVLRKHDERAPHATLLVLDATTGQNALAQVETFQKAAPLTGLVVTKLDGSARGGVIVALAERFGIPVNAVGVGEGAEDLRPFSARDFARGLMGLNDR